MTKTTKVELDIEKFPYMNQKKLSIESRKELVDLYKKRKELIENNWSSLSAYEQNERKITLNLTEQDLAITQKQIHDMQSQFDTRIMSIVNLLDELEEKWDYIMKEANRIKAKNIELTKYLEETPIDNFENNTEEKLAFYMKVRGFVNPPKGAMRLKKAPELTIAK